MFLSRHIKGGKNLSSKNQKLFDDIYAKAPDAKREIDDLADDIANSVNGKVAKAPIKSKDRAVEKIVNDYEGDPSKIKDLARNTIITSDKNIDSVVAKLKDKGANVKIIDGKSDPLGYSGVNTTVKTNTGLTGEIQVNTAEMIYAKEPESMARILMGDDAYNAISSKTNVPGGQGHKFYEEWRKLPDNSQEAKSIASQSKAYYDSIRGGSYAN